MIPLLFLAALLALALQARRGWSLVQFGTWNIGPGNADDLIDALTRCSMLFLQEAGDRASMIYRVASRRGWKVITGQQAGQASTPLIYDNAVFELVQASRLLLAHRQDVGPGAGPDTLKEKWLIGGLFRHRATGRLFWAYSAHYVATQGKRKRRLVALAMSHKILLRMRSLVRLVMVGADFNTEQGSEVMDALTDNRQVGYSKPLATHGKRAIDRIIWTLKSWLHYLDTEAFDTTSDHRLLVVTQEWQPRAKRRG